MSRSNGEALEDDRARLREIERSASEIVRLRTVAAIAKEDAMDAKKDWEEAVSKHMELCSSHEDSLECAERPLVKLIEGKVDVTFDPSDETLGAAVEQAMNQAERGDVDGALKTMNAATDQELQRSGFDLVTSRPKRGRKARA